MSAGQAPGSPTAARSVQASLGCRRRQSCVDCAGDRLPARRRQGGHVGEGMTGGEVAGETEGKWPATGPYPVFSTKRPLMYLCRMLDMSVW